MYLVLNTQETSHFYWQWFHIQKKNRENIQSYLLTHTAGWDTIFSHTYLLTWEVDFIEILEIMAQMWQYVIFLSLKPTKVTSDFILN